MERSKRPQTDAILDYNNNKKKPKLDYSSENANKSLFEDLANETIYEIFDYLEITHAYDAFFNLNKRFGNLLLYSNLPIQVNISTMSKTSFKRYHKNVIIPNKHRINYLRLSNPFTVDMIFSPPYIISEFIQLETLILDHINAKYLRNIFTHAIRLLKLQTLVLSLADLVDSPDQLFTWIFRLSKLKSCKISYPIKDEQDPPLILMSELRASSIEYLVINSRLRFDSLEDLFSCLPNLRHLSINCLVGHRSLGISSYIIRLKHLKYVSLELDGVRLSRLEKLMRNFFHHVEDFRLTVKYDRRYFDANLWEQLIESYMPNLRIFDINYKGAVDNSSSYHQLVDQFNSPFWIERGWSFNHQHFWPDSLNSGVFYSTDPYRRRNYSFYWPFADQTCPYLYENNLNSVKHVYIGSKQATDSPVNYFPNAIELTIENYIKTPDDSIATTLHRIIPLEQLTKLFIEGYGCPLKETIDLLRCTPNLHTLKFYLPTINENELELIKQNNLLQYVSKTNKIKNVQICSWCRFESIKFIVRLFSRMEYLETGMDRKQIEQIMRYLIIKNDNPRRCLCFLRILRIPKICLHEVDRLIKSQQLLNDYSIKFLNRDLYFWW